MLVRRLSSIIPIRKLATHPILVRPRRCITVSSIAARDTAVMPATKRKRAVVDKATTDSGPVKRRTATRHSSSAAAVVNPDVNAEVVDAPDATRASPDGDVNGGIVPGPVEAESPLSEVPEVDDELPSKKGGRGRGKKRKEEVKEAVVAVVDAAAENGGEAKKGKGRPKAGPRENGDMEASKPAAERKPAKTNGDEAADPEAEGDEEADEEEVKEALSRPPPVNSDYLPLPWKGRLGYACLNTYLRNANPPVFSSRTCRIQSILEHRHPLRDPTQPEHPTKNRPDRSKPADVALGQRYVEGLCLANVKDIAKMIRWNDRYNIKFLRLSSEMFPFASHPEYGYGLAPFASEALAEAGKVIAELGHRVTTHPGQFTQLGSPRKQVIDNSIRDLVYHEEMLSLLKLPAQQDRDAVMILHMGGIFEGKQETLARFRANYAALPDGVKRRLVLENDDMGWSVHDLLPTCEELDIPMVLDFHHHNIVFDPARLREGTRDIMDLYPRIRATWDRKRITPKMHYSEPTPAAITPRQRRKHNPRVATLPPCPPDMDLMIEAKDKEQAVFELMRAFKLPGFDRINDVLPHSRADDNKLATAAMAKRARSDAKKGSEGGDLAEADVALVPEEEVGMGGPEGRVYWPPGMEEWLRPKKREVKKKAEPVEKAAGKVKRELEEAYAKREAEKEQKKKKKKGAKKGEVVNDAAVEAVEGEEESDENATPATKKAKAAMRKKEKAVAAKDGSAAPAVVKKAGRKTKVVPAPDPLSDDSEELSLDDDADDGEDFVAAAPLVKRSSAGTRKAGKRSAKQRVSYAEQDDDSDVE